MGLYWLCISVIYFYMRVRGLPPRTRRKKDPNGPFIKVCSDFENPKSLQKLSKIDKKSIGESSPNRNLVDFWCFGGINPLCYFALPCDSPTPPPGNAILGGFLGGQKSRFLTIKNFSQNSKKIDFFQFFLSKNRFFWKTQILYFFKNFLNFPIFTHKNFLKKVDFFQFCKNCQFLKKNENFSIFCKNWKS